MSVIGIITARGGSKRIPRKNIKSFCGKPIIAYTIEAAIQSGVFDEVMVSTDDPKIADVAKEYGASIPFMRSADNSGDLATTADVLKEVIVEYRKQGKEFDVFCCLYPTAPFITPQKLRDAMDEFDKSDCDSLITVVRYGFPPQRALLIENGFLRYQYPENEKKRSQDLEPIYHDCGQFYLCKTASFEEYNSLLAGKTVPFIIPEEEVQDIDTVSDWRIAEAKYRVMHDWREDV